MEVCCNFCLTAGVGGSAEDMNFLFMLYENLNIQELEMWVVDSAASNHFTALKSNIRNFIDISPVKVLTGNGIILGLGRGNVVLSTKIGSRVIYDVIWVPELQGGCALLSVTQLMRQGKKIICDGDGCKVEEKGELFLTGTLVNKAIYIDLAGRNEVRPLGGSMKATGVEEVVFLHGISDKATIQRWHVRLGYLNQEAITKLQKISTGIVLDKPEEMTRQHMLNEPCKGCLQGSH